MAEIRAIFNFVARNPSTMLIAGGILCLLIGSLLKAADPSSGTLLLIIGGILIVAGVYLNIKWLETR